MIRVAKTVRRTGVLFGVVAVLAACSSSSSPTSATGGGGGSSGQSVQAAVTATNTAYQGTSRPVDSTPRAAATTKTVAVISAGQAANSSAVPANGAVDAAHAMGWQVHLYDAAINPSNYAPLVRQAIAAGVNGIILDAIDCATVKEPLQEARQKGIAVVGLYAFDCNDPHTGGSSQPSLFTANVSFGPQNPNIDAFTGSYGAEQARYIIAKSNNTAKIIVIQDPEFTVLYWTYQGFVKTINASGGSQILDTLNITTNDLTHGTLESKIQSELLRFPNATWVKSPYTYVTTLGIAPALANNSGHVSVMGGEGFHDELDLIRQSKITATNAISSDWQGWAAVDTLNSAFLHQKPVDSGIGWTIVDATHNLPSDPNADWTPPINYKAEYKKAWGVG
jgi:ribose transport system substrate-binding protein